MTQRVLEVKKYPKDSVNWTYLHLEKLFLYASFLVQKLELWMFIPCKLVDSIWIVLEEPNKEDYIFEDHPELVGNPKEYDLDKFESDLKEYEEAKSRVLFEEFHEFLNNVSNGKLELNIDTFWFSDIQENGIAYGQAKIIEDLIGWNIELTLTAQKQSGR